MFVDGLNLIVIIMYAVIIINYKLASRRFKRLCKYHTTEMGGSTSCLLTYYMMRLYMGDDEQVQKYLDNYGKSEEPTCQDNEEDDEFFENGENAAETVFDNCNEFDEPDVSEYYDDSARDDEGDEYLGDDYEDDEQE